MLLTYKDGIKMRCPKCGELMQKWYLLGGEARWDCPNEKCGYREEIK